MPFVNSKEDLVRYRQYLSESDYAKFTQDPNRAKVKKNRTSDLVYLEENKKIIAAMSVLGIRNQNGSYFLYAPRGPVCDFSDYDLVSRLIKEASPLKDKYGAFLLRLDPEIAVDERAIYEYRKLGYDFRSIEAPIRSFTQPRYNMVIDMGEKTPEEVFAGFSPKGRYNIRKSIKSGIKTVLKTDQESIDTLYKLTEIMAERQKISHRPKDYFERLIKYYDGKIFTSYYMGKALSSSLLIFYHDKVYYLYAASSNENRNTMPNYNMIREEIKYSIKRGYRYFDLGGVFSLDMEDGLYRFKQNFCYPHKYTAYIGELDVVYDREKYEEFIVNK